MFCHLVICLASELDNNDSSNNNNNNHNSNLFDVNQWMSQIVGIPNFVANTVTGFLGRPNSGTAKNETNSHLNTTKTNKK